MNNNDHRNRVALVTGGSGGIGLAVARRLAAEGATILLWDLNADSLGKTTASQPDWHVRTVDITDFEDVSAALGDALNQLGRIDIMVHCAGFSGKNYRVEDYPNDLWSKIIEINLTGTYHVCKAVVPAMAAAGFGRVINLASMAGKEGMPTVSAYSAAKAGVIAFTKAIAKEYLDGDVRINAIAPSAIETPLLQQMAPETLEMAKSKIPMGRFGTVEEVAAMASWLASADCSFSTGAVFDLSGGRATY